MPSTSIGVFLGLLVGKQVGVFAASFVVVRLGLAELPAGVSWGQLWGCAVLCGIGFTMSIFISDLAFENEQYKQIAKVGIMGASLLSALVGMAWLGLTGRKR